jgi:hypothetical protein
MFKKLKGQYFDRHVRTASSPVVWAKHRSLSARSTHTAQAKRLQPAFLAAMKYLKYSMSSCAWLSGFPASHPMEERAAEKLLRWSCGHALVRAPRILVL